mgnify:CR=1 FL=1
MNNIQEIVAAVLVAIGLLFLIISAVGMLRLPDFYSRLHASGNSETLGLMTVLLGLAVYEGVNLLSVKLIFIFIFVFIGNPIGTHILSKAALASGHPVWTKKRKEKEEEGGIQDADTRL